MPPGCTPVFEWRHRVPSNHLHSSLRAKRLIVGSAPTIRDERVTELPRSVNLDPLPDPPPSSGLLIPSDRFTASADQWST